MFPPACILLSLTALRHLPPAERCTDWTPPHGPDAAADAADEDDEEEHVRR